MGFTPIYCIFFMSSVPYPCRRKTHHCSDLGLKTSAHTKNSKILTINFHKSAHIDTELAAIYAQADL